MTTTRPVWIEDADQQLLNLAHVARIRPKLHRTGLNGEETWEVLADVIGLGYCVLARRLEGRAAALAFMREFATGMDAATEKTLAMLFPGLGR